MFSPLLIFHPILAISDPRGLLTSEQINMPVGHKGAGMGEYSALLSRLTVFTLSSKMNSSGATHLASGCGHTESPLMTLLEHVQSKADTVNKVVVWEAS